MLDHVSLYTALYGVFMLDQDTRTSGMLKALGTVVGACNAILWSFITVVPLVQVSIKAVTVQY